MPRRRETLASCRVLSLDGIVLNPLDGIILLASDPLKLPGDFIGVVLRVVNGEP